MSKQEQKVKEGIAPMLGEGEEVLAAMIARPRGWTQTHAKRLLARKVVKLRVRGGDEIKLEVNAAADVKGLIAAFEASRATA
jgi:phosphatidate phosphatase APP1